MVSADVLEHATRVRRELHRVPELCYEEHETAALIRRELDRLGVKYAQGPDDATTATVAVLGDAGKPCVLLRADIDGLAITEATGAEHASTAVGRMHACGHDGHAANLLGVAAMLRDEVDDLPVCVKLVWQPAEEGGGGAKRLVDAGLLDATDKYGPKVVAAFGLHGWPMLPVGVVSTKPGPLLAATDSFSLTFRGDGGHAAQPHVTRDPLACAASCVCNLQQFVSRDLDPTEPAVLSVTQFHAGTAYNVIPAEAVLRGTARTLTPAARELVREVIGRRAHGIAAAGGCDVEMVWKQGYPPTVNDPHMADYVAAVARDVLGAASFVPAARPTMGGEDFAYYLEKVPGCFFLVGLMPPGSDAHPGLHTDRFDFTDAALETGINLMCELVRRFEPA